MLAPDIISETSLCRLRLVVRGAVQGVGFRPFVYRLATQLDLHGWVLNASEGVVAEVEGSLANVEQFRQRVEREHPPRSIIQSVSASFLDPVGSTAFEIHHSDTAKVKTALILPDIATCSDCVREIVDPQNRRYRYPFTNCTHCGPRYSIIGALPYDRSTTTMRGFIMCEQCQAEYGNPMDRRFHAQPNACPCCGPHLELWHVDGHCFAFRDDALRAAGEAIRGGQVVAVKGLGGFHLMADARNEAVVQRLRQRKHREDKPLALMVPSVTWVREQCLVSELEERLLTSPEAPIILLQRWRAAESDLARSIAPGNPYLGVMLPSTPLHHLLMHDLGIPVVATSGNLSDEPICTDEHEALARLGSVADCFLVHNRPIRHHVDDSVVRVMAGREMILRRARGYAPLPIHGVCVTDASFLAVGAHLKNSVAVTVGENVILSQHIGDLETAESYNAFGSVIGSFEQLYERQPAAVACDAHPDYLSTQYARKTGKPVVPVQHHYAHVLACMAENGLDGSVLGVSWDGTGYGLDGTIWGGEFLLATREGFRRVAHLRPFPLPGGDQAAREPRRSAIGMLFQLFNGNLFTRTDLLPVRAFAEQERVILQTMLRRGLNAPFTTSAGRLFDAVAAIVGLRQRASFEGQAAMELEYVIGDTVTDEAYPISLDSPCPPFMLDWEPMIRALLEDLHGSVPIGTISAKVHNSLVESIIQIAEQLGEARVVLTGGCFQNRYLTERSIARLQARGFSGYWHHQVPPNDGGIALGQIIAAQHLVASH